VKGKDSGEKSEEKKKKGGLTRSGTMAATIEEGKKYLKDSRGRSGKKK